MRVLHLLHSYPPSSEGGTERYVSTLVRELARRGVSSIVVAGSSRPDGIEEVTEGVVAATKVVRLPPRMWDANARAGADVWVRGVIERLIGSERPDLVHVHHWAGLTNDAVATVHAAGVPSVVTLHDFFSTCVRFHRLPDAKTPCAADTSITTCARCVQPMLPAGEEYLVAALEERNGLFHHELNLAATVLTLSASQTAYLERIPWLAEVAFRTLPLPNPLGPPSPGRGPDPGAVAANGVVRLVTWGGLDPGKGLAALVDACERSASPARFEIHHHGRILDPEYAGRLRADARRTPLVLHGPFEDRDLRERFARYDAAVFPSHYMETHGFAVDEAMAVGLPVLVPDRGAPCERVGTRGLVYEAGNVASLRDRLERLLEPETLPRLRAGTPVEWISLEDHGRALLRIYRAAVDAFEGDAGVTPGASPSA